MIPCCDKLSDPFTAVIVTLLVYQLAIVLLPFTVIVPAVGLVLSNLYASLQITLLFLPFVSVACIHILLFALSVLIILVAVSVPVISLPVDGSHVFVVAVHKLNDFNVSLDESSSVTVT